MVIKADMIIFDMDGVLVDVRESYRETICVTVEHFTSKQISRELIQEYKNQGGWNNDWSLSQKICADMNVEVAYDAVVEYFNGIFFGENNDGLILRAPDTPLASTSFARAMTNSPCASSRSTSAE